jgi:hypothetical protein
MLVGKPQEKRLLWRHRYRCEDNIKMNFYRNSVWKDRLDRTGVGYSPMVGLYEHGNEPSASIRAGSFLSSCQIFQ